MWKLSCVNITRKILYREVTKSSISNLIIHSWQLLYRYSAKRTIAVGILLFLISIAELISLMTIYPLLKFIINPNEAMASGYFHYLKFISLPPSSYIYILLVSSLSFVLLSSALRIVGITLFSKYSFQIASNISSWRYDLLMSCINNDPVAMHSASKILQEVKEFPIKLPTVLILPSLQIPQAALTLFFILSYTLTSSFYPSIIILTFITTSYFLVYKLIKPKLYLYGEKMNATSRDTTNLTNILSIGWKEVFAYNLVSEFKAMISKAIDENSYYNYKSYSLSGTPKIALESLILSSVLLCAFTSVILKTDIIADLALVAFAFLKALPYMQTLFGAFSGLANNMNLVQTLQLDDYLVSNQSLSQENYFQSLPHKSNILLEIKSHELDLSIHLPKNSKIKSKLISPLSITNGVLKLEACTKFAIIGPSGSGKTLFLDYIAGVRDVNYQIVSPSSNRQFFAYSTQFPMIGPFSFTQNITLSRLENSDINRKKFKSIVDFLELQNVSQRLKDTQLSENHDLSGGEAQRISIARSMMSSSPLLILDEPTSPLHPALAEKFLKGLPNFLHNKTLFMTLHSNNIPDWIDVTIELL